MGSQAELISKGHVKGYPSLVPGLISTFSETVWVPLISNFRLMGHPHLNLPTVNGVIKISFLAWFLGVDINRIKEFIRHAVRLGKIPACMIITLLKTAKIPKYTGQYH